MHSVVGAHNSFARKEGAYSPPVCDYFVKRGDSKCFAFLFDLDCCLFWFVYLLTNLDA